MFCSLTRDVDIFRAEVIHVGQSVPTLSCQNVLKQIIRICLPVSEKSKKADSCREWAIWM